jgi:hypothetical protein
LVIDDTAAVSSAEIPPAFKMVHIEQAPEGGLQAHQAEAIVKAFNAMRERHAGRQ